ncbi:MAG: hypothetical protein AAFQ95_09835 [Cyanobacteria bacterium J06621_3]
MANELFSLFEYFSGLPSQGAAPQANSKALLALGRFLRGTFQRVGLAAVALLFVVHLSAQVGATPVEGTSGQNSHFNSQPLTQDSTPGSRHASLLRANLTHHHLTSARLSLPPLPMRAIADLSAIPSTVSADADHEFMSDRPDNNY